jgi:hypothetical protein
VRLPDVHSCAVIFADGQADLAVSIAGAGGDDVGGDDADGVVVESLMRHTAAPANCPARNGGNHWSMIQHDPVRLERIALRTNPSEASFASRNSQTTIIRGRACLASSSKKTIS